MPDSSARIQARIDGREAAVVTYGLLVDQNNKPWQDGTGADYAEWFLKELANLLPKRQCEEPKEEAMEPIARLGATVMPFGQYNGRTFDDTPVEYLDWLCASQEGFYYKLRAYLTHSEVQSRRVSC